MIAAALEVEVGEDVGSLVDEVGRRLVVRNRHARERRVTVGSGTVPSVCRGSTTSASMPRVASRCALARGSCRLKTKPELGVELVERASGWQVPKAPVLGDAAYGDNTALRERLHGAGTDYALPARKRAAGRPPRRLRPDREPVAIADLIAGLGCDEWRTVAFRDGPDGEPMTSRFAFVRVRAAHLWQRGYVEDPREEWLIAEWPAGEQVPTDYWLSNLSADTEHEPLARLARLRWKIELDYRQFKGELSLDHYEGRSWLGWHHHTALVTAAHGFLILELLRDFRQRPA